MGIKKIRKFINSIEKDNIGHQKWYDKIFEWLNDIIDMLVWPLSPASRNFATVKAFLKFLLVVFCGVALVIIIFILISLIYSVAK